MGLHYGSISGIYASSYCTGDYGNRAVNSADRSYRCSCWVLRSGVAGSERAVMLALEGDHDVVLAAFELIESIEWEP